MLRICVALLIVALAYPGVVLLLSNQYGVAMFVGMFTVGASLLIGLPLVAWCLRRGRLSVWHATVGGAFAGLSCAAALLLLDGTAGLAFPFVAFGAVHGLALWVLAFWRNPYVQRSLGTSRVGG
jgi:peptidoglycan/LPS O-acetylase OafA/YrhL